MGTHKVTISTSSEENFGGSDEKIPAKYNSETELKETLKAGKNVVDFKLVTQP